MSSILGKGNSYGKWLDGIEVCSVVESDLPGKEFLIVNLCTSGEKMLSYWGLTFMGSMIVFMMKNKAELEIPSQMSRQLYSMEQQLYNSTLAPGPTV